MSAGAPDARRLRGLFLRLLAVTYAAAFVSLGVQVRGLVGAGGILPAAEFLEWVRARTGGERYLLLPTLCWLDARDATLVGLCVAGLALAVLLWLRIAPRLVLFLLWAAYLSLAKVCRVFLGYQWDALLLETGFLAILFAPPGLRPTPGREPPPSRLVLWLLRFLLVRLMVSSGLVKLLSGDPTWRGLSALRYHYWTQPLPTPLAWYAHQLPDGMQALSVAVMFVVELGAPLLAFAHRRLRRAGAWALLVLQALIALTGNYAFFNLLAAALALLLLDDGAWPLRRGPQGAAPEAGPARAAGPLVVGAASLLFALEGTQALATVGIGVPPPLSTLHQAAGHFEIVNGYGLFAVMTTGRPEIVLEGSADGTTWRPYPFRFKPGDPARAPRFVAPHQPRLDWQMWFAALGSCEQNPWLPRLMLRLLEGSPAVERLFAENPFAQRPPGRVRAVLYEYRFATGSEPGWWRREERGQYCPVLSREDAGVHSR